MAHRGPAKTTLQFTSKAVLLISVDGTWTYNGLSSQDLAVPPVLDDKFCSMYPVMPFSATFTDPDNLSIIIVSTGRERHPIVIAEMPIDGKFSHFDENLKALSNKVDVAKAILINDSLSLHVQNDGDEVLCPALLIERQRLSGLEYELGEFKNFRDGFMRYKSTVGDEKKVETEPGHVFLKRIDDKLDLCFLNTTKLHFHSLIGAYLKLHTESGLFQFVESGKNYRLNPVDLSDIRPRPVFQIDDTNQEYLLLFEDAASRLCIEYFSGQKVEGSFYSKNPFILESRDIDELELLDSTRYQNNFSVFAIENPGLFKFLDHRGLRGFEPVTVYSELRDSEVFPEIGSPQKSVDKQARKTPTRAGFTRTSKTSTPTSSNNLTKATGPFASSK